MGTSKIWIWAELSYKLGPSWQGPSFMWAELAWAELVLGRVVRNSFKGLPTGRKEGSFTREYDRCETSPNCVFQTQRLLKV